MNRISDEMAARYHLPPIQKYPHPTEDWYQTFLLQTDYVTAKLIEAVAMGESTEQYTDVIEARRIARECINAIQDGTYTGEEAMQEVEIEEAQDDENLEVIIL